MDDADHRHALAIDAIKQAVRPMGKGSDAVPECRPFLTAVRVRAQQREEALKSMKMASCASFTERRLALFAYSVEGPGYTID